MENVSVTSPRGPNPNNKEPTKKTNEKQTGKVIYLDAERAGESKIVRHPHSAKGLVERENTSITTLYESFQNAVSTGGENRCIGWRKGEEDYQWLTYNEVAKRAHRFGSGLLHLGLKPHTDRLGIYAPNCIEWALSEQASNMYSICVVPLYDSLGTEACNFIVNQTELTVIVCAVDKAKILLANIKDLPTLKTIIIIGDSVPEDLKEIAEKQKNKVVAVISYASIEQIGKNFLRKAEPPKPEDLSTICYTSGTTGNPKGVMLTHANFIADMAGAFIGGLTIKPTDVHISYLPLAHVFERIVFNAILYWGGCCGFFRGDVKLLFDDIQTLKPTVFPSVPRIWNVLYAKVFSSLDTAGKIKSILFHKAYSAKQEGLKHGRYTDKMWDPIFAKVREKLGGNVRLLVTGSAPIAPHVMEFLRICFACPVVEGYGQTETCAAATLTPLEETSVGNVGIPMPCVEIKLVDLPELGYTSEDKPFPRGEVCFRGPCCCKGYYKDAEKTKELIDEHGWYHSGDVGAYLEDGSIKIVDRAKNLFKLQQGEYIAPEKLENVFVQSSWISQCFVYGDSLQSQVIAICTPNEDNFITYAKANNMEPVDIKKLCADPAVVQMVLKDLDAIGRAAGLKGFELIKALYLSPTPFTIDQGILTPTFKLKRPQARDFFKEQINELYSKLEAENSTQPTASVTSSAGYEKKGKDDDIIKKTTSKKHVRDTKDEKQGKQKISKADLIEEHEKLLHDHELLKEEVKQLKAEFEAFRKEIRGEVEAKAEVKGDVKSKKSAKQGKIEPTSSSSSMKADQSKNEEKPAENSTASTTTTAAAEGDDKKIKKKVKKSETVTEKSAEPKAEEKVEGKAEEKVEDKKDKKSKKEKPAESTSEKKEEAKPEERKDKKDKKAKKEESKPAESTSEKKEESKTEEKAEGDAAKDKEEKKKDLKKSRK